MFDLTLYWLKRRLTICLAALLLGMATAWLIVFMIGVLT